MDSDQLTIKDYAESFDDMPRTNKEGKVTYHVDGTDQELIDLTRQCHGDRMPDDWVYEKCSLIADALANDDYDQDLEALAACLVECYTAELLDWAYPYLDEINEALSEAIHAGEIVTITDVIQRAQYAVIFDMVLTIANYFDII